MKSFSTKYNGIRKEIVTEVAVFDPKDELPNGDFPQHFFTDNAAWDTGSEATIISQEIVDAFGLKPVGKGGMFGIGGGQAGDLYRIHLGLPDKQMIKNIIAFNGGDDLDYDVLIGMDVISKMDFLITNKDNTVFSFRYPSEGNVEIK